MKPENKTIEIAKKLMSDAKEEEIFIVNGTSHMYSKQENAIAQAKGQNEVYRLKKGSNEVELVFDPKKEEAKKDEKPQGDTPDNTWTVEALKKFAEEKGIALDEKDKKPAILEKITAALAASGAGQ